MADQWGVVKTEPIQDPWAVQNEPSAFDRFMTEVKGVPSQMPRQLGLAARNIATGVLGIPGMAADAAMAGVNLATGRNYQMPSQATQQLMTQMGLPEAQNAPEKFAGFVESGLAGSRVPMPSGPQVPANFQKPMTRAQEVFTQGREQGYVVPPATIQPNVATRTLESAGGKINTAQEASLKNQQVTNALAAKALDLPANTQITRPLLEDLRNQAGQVYERLKGFGKIIADKDYLSQLDKIPQSAEKIMKDFPDTPISGAENISKLVESLKRPEFDSESAINLVKTLRAEASANFAKANDPAALAYGRAQREAAGALEDAVMRNINRYEAAQKVAPEFSSGKSFPSASEFDNARRLIAKTYSVENALNPATGNVMAQRLATQLQRGKPLSGELLTASEFAKAFPKATQTVENIGSPGVSKLDFLTGLTSLGLGTGAGFQAGHPALGAALGTAGAVARHLATPIALSRALQAQLLRGPRQIPPELLAGMPGAIYSQE